MDRQDEPWYPRYRPGHEQDPAPGPDGGGPGQGAGGGRCAPDADGGLWRPPGPGPAAAPAPPPPHTSLPSPHPPPDDAWVPAPAHTAEPARGPNAPEPAARRPLPTSRPRGPRRTPIPRQPGAGGPGEGNRRGRRPAPGGAPGPRPPAELPTWSGHVHVNEDVDLDELDPLGRARRRAALKDVRGAGPHPRRRKALRILAGSCAALVLAVAGVGTYAYEHLFGAVATESLDALTDRPAFSKADRFGNVPLNILVLGSQTRDGQHGMNLGNSTKLGTDISDTAMLVHISAERKWATVVSIPRDLMVPRPECTGRLDPTQPVPASPDAMFDLAMNLGGPTCAVATVEQMTGIRIDHFVEINFNAFQALTDAVGGVTVCVPPPGINDPHYSGLVLGPGLHTISGPESLAFVRDRHGLANGTDLNRIRMQQMFVSSLFDQLASAGTLGDPITLYKIVNAVTSNLTVDTGLDSIDAMVDLVGSVQSLSSHYIQFITVPYGFDPTNQNRVIPGSGFDQVWSDLRQDAPLPGSNAAAAFGTATTTVPSAAVPSATAPSAAVPSAVAAANSTTLSGFDIEVYNGTETPHLALYSSENLTAMGAHAVVGQNEQAVARYEGLPGTAVLYPDGEAAQARRLAAALGGTVTTLQSPNVTGLTLVVGPDAPTALVGPPADGGAAGSSDASSQAPSGDAGAAGSAPAPTISAESRAGDENICSDLPDTVSYGGRP
jgi:LCP family protein required for cell wall assembly